MAGNTIKVVAINGSPKLGGSNTALILTPFLEGLEEAGAEVEMNYVKDLHIHPCHGDLCCWLRTPGRCFQQDDMQMLLPKLQQADIWVIATPLYVDGLAGPLKNLIDRLIPLLQPFFTLRDGHCRHLVQEGHKYGKVVLVANCGFWEMDNFGPLLTFMQSMCKNLSREFAGALLRPHGEAMRPMMKQKAMLDDIFEAAREAGRQLVRQGTMNRQTLDTVSRELLPRETYLELINANFARILCRDRNTTVQKVQPPTEQLHQFTEENVDEKDH